MPKKLTLPLKQKKLTNIPQEEEVKGQLPQKLLQKPKPKQKSQPMSFLLPDDVGFEHQFSSIENIKQSNMYNQLFPKEPITKRTSGGSGVVEIYMTKQQDQKQDQNNFVVVKRFQTPGEYKKQKQKFTRSNKQSSKIYFPQFITEYQTQADLYEALPMRNRFGKAKTLDKLLNESTLDPTQLQTLADNLIQAVTTINADGIFHGDIKPENIIVSPTLEVQFIDVGSMGFQNKVTPSQQYQWRGTESPLYCPDWFVTMRSRNKFSFSEMVKLDQFAMAKIVSNMFRSKQQTENGKTIKKWLKQGEAMDKIQKKEQSTTQPVYQIVAQAA